MITLLAFLAALLLTLCFYIARHDSKYRASYRGKASYDHDKETMPEGWKP